MKVSSSFYCSLVVWMAIAFPPVAKGENLIENSGFEAGVDGWVLMVPPESQGSTEVLDVTQEQHHGASFSAVMKAFGPVRFGLAPKKLIPVEPGQRYRISAWVNFGDDSYLEKAAPVVYLRATLLNSAKLDVKTPPEHLHIGLRGEVVNSGALIDKLSVSDIPKGWRKIEGVIEMPEETFFLSPNLFVHGVSGTVYWDDVLVEQVSSNTPLSTVLKAD